MKYLHLIDTDGPGGAQILLRNMLRLDTSKNHYLFALRSKKISVFEENNQIFTTKNKTPNTYIAYKQLKKILQNHSFEVLICHLPHAQMLGLLVKKWINPKLKIVFYEHGDVFEKNFKTPIIKKWYMHFSNKLSGVICVADFLKREVMRLSENKFPIVHLPNAVFKAEIKRVSKRKQIQQFGFLGRITARKNWQMFLNLAEKNPLNQFIITGSGEEEKKLKRAIKNKSLKNVLFNHYLNDSNEFYEQIDALIICSDFEGHPLVKLEALQRQIPVIALNSPGLNEAPHQGVFYFDTVKQGSAIIQKLNKFGMDFPCSAAMAEMENYTLSPIWIAELERNIMAFEDF